MFCIWSLRSEIPAVNGGFMKAGTFTTPAIVPGYGRLVF